MKAKSFLIGAILLFTAIQAQANNGTTSTNFKVSTSESNIEWVGRKVGGSHNGNIAIQEGNLVVDGNKLVSGSFTVEMNSITCLDISDAGSNARLVNHLKSDDFFGVENHPLSKLTIKKVDHKSGNQYEVTGDLTIKGITHEIAFPATIQVSNNKITANADITVDRTNYDIKFRSGRFFDSLGDRLIYDNFTLKVNLVANQQVL
jgi:polyisoprenoid-binding protein YceI